jgi:outer membrane protein assembly factor BamB
VDAPTYEARVWPVHLLELNRAPSAGEYVGDSIVELWTRDVGKSSAGPLALGDSVILAAAADKRVTLLRRDDGAVVWKRRLKGVGTSGVLFTHTRAYAASGDVQGQLHAWDLLTGKQRWNRLVGPVQRPIALREGTLYAGTTAGAVVAVGIDRGTVRWQRFFRRPVRSGVTVLDDRLFVASEDSLFFLDPASGTVEVGVLAPGVVTQPPAIHGTALVIVSPDRLIAGLDAMTLDVLWQLDIEAPILGGVAIARDTAYAATLSGDLWRVPLAAPRAASRLALARTIRATPAPVHNGVLLGTVAGEILFVDGRSGTPRWSRIVDGPIEFPPIVDQGTIFVYDGRGTIHAWASAAPDDGLQTSGEPGPAR